jgi:hypothetical protein
MDDAMQFKKIEHKQNFLLLFMIFICLFPVWSCSEGKSFSEDPDSGTGALSFNVVYHDRIGDNLRSETVEIGCESQGVTDVEALVYDSVDKLLTKGGPWDCHARQGTIAAVPAGSDRTVVILGKNADGVVIFRGQKSSITVTAGSENKTGIIECYAFVPNLSAPANDATVIRGAVVLQWEGVTGATDYEVLVSQNSDMANPVVKAHPSSAYHSPSGLSAIKTYYWQVFAVDREGNWGIGSQIRSLTVAGGLPGTGQTSDYTDTVGEDSDYTINPPEYTKLDASGNVLTDTADDWAMVRDDVTGLTWENKSDLADIHNVDDTYTWQGAQDNFIARLNDDYFGGYSDWRLPTIKELYTLTHKGRYNTAVNPDYFPIIRYSTGLPRLVYWSSTTYTRDPSLAWYLDFRDGDTYYSSIGDDPIGSKDHLNFAIAVRGRQANSALVDNNDGTVTDTATGLIWQKSGPTNQSGAAIALTWEEALAYCEKLELNEKDDWRLPNVNELQSIVDYRFYNPSVDVTFFPDTQSEPYWSSTTYAPDNGIAWDISFFNGDVLVNYRSKLETRYVRAVRGGQ